MARDRVRKREVRQQREREALVADERRRARAWVIRAVLLAVPAALVWSLSSGVALVLLAGVVACLVQAVRQAVAAERHVE